MQGLLCSCIARRWRLSLASPVLLSGLFRDFSHQFCRSSPAGGSDPGALGTGNPPSGSSATSQAIWAVERLGKGKWFSSHDRKQGRIPGYVYDNESLPDQHVLIVVDKYQIHNLWWKMGQETFMSTVFPLEVYDGLGSRRILYQETVLPRRLNFNEHGEICNVGFVRAPPGVKLRLDSTIRFCGDDKCIGIKKGGVLKIHRTHLSFFCLPHLLPPYVEVNISNLDIGDRILIQDIQTKVRMHSKLDPSSEVCEIVKCEAG